MIIFVIIFIIYLLINNFININLLLIIIEWKGFYKKPRIDPY